jgi:oxygen-independent coproporphyrinogen-3 oxidase
MSEVPHPTLSSPLITPALLKRYDIPGPRYTSYPTADRFSDGVVVADLLDALRKNTVARRPLSLYVHIPFCESLCYYCACNKIITHDHSKAARYLDYLAQEVRLYTQALPERPLVSQLHLGGGTPTFLNDDELGRLMALLRSAFTLLPDGEYSVEVDPRTVDSVRLAAMYALGFNRLSFGVQDFDADVQLAVHRVQTVEHVESLMQAARRIGFHSLNMDLIYGLPKQTVASFRTTLERVCRLRPDRIALYAYAHLPDRFKSQRHIVNGDLPDAATKLELLSQSIAALLDAGYVYIGMDHFALPDDALAQARKNSRLHRNFQGYSTQPDCDLVALGVSGISKIGNHYSQNAKTLSEYYSGLDENRLPVVRGLTLSADDLLRRDIITALMCQGRLEKADIATAHGIDFDRYFASELTTLAMLEKQGLVQLLEARIIVTELGWFFVRAVAMVFDRYLPGSLTRFSRII